MLVNILAAQIVDQSMFGKLKIWCLQFWLLPRLMWPLTMYDITLKREDVRKWLGVPPCRSSIGLCGLFPASQRSSNALQWDWWWSWQNQRITVIPAAAQTLATGKKVERLRMWHSGQTLHHGDTVGQVQHRRSGLKLGAGTKHPNKSSWSLQTGGDDKFPHLSDLQCPSYFALWISTSRPVYLKTH